MIMPRVRDAGVHFVLDPDVAPEETRSWRLLRTLG